MVSSAVPISRMRDRLHELRLPCCLLRKADTASGDRSGLTRVASRHRDVAIVDESEEHDSRNARRRPVRRRSRQKIGEGLHAIGPDEELMPEKRKVDWIVWRKDGESGEMGYYQRCGENLIVVPRSVFGCYTVNMVAGLLNEFIKIHRRCKKPVYGLCTNGGNLSPLSPLSPPSNQ